MRRCVSLWTRAEMRDFISLTIFSSSSADCALSLRFEELSLAAISRSTTLATIALTAERAEDLLRLALELRLGAGARSGRR